MDKQTSTTTLTTKTEQFPVNTRTIGTPEGIYILYLEDYVHTFIKKLLNAWNEANMALKEDDEYHIEQTAQPNIALYGKSIEENGRYRIVISGAANIGYNTEKIQQINDTYFPDSIFIATAKLSSNKDSNLRMELTFNSTRVIIDDFYIYYDQNEQMQNYLIEWNTNKGAAGNNKNSIKADYSTENEPIPMRSNTDEAVRIGRLMQAYNKEDAKVSFMWNVMNVLCLGFVVCVMAYGVISINNYSKMQAMQENIDYCMALLKEYTSKDSSNDANNEQAVATMQQNPNNSNTTSQTVNTNTEDIIQEKNVIIETQTSTQPEEQQNLQTAVAQENIQQAAIEENQKEQEELQGSNQLTQENNINTQANTSDPVQQSNTSNNTNSNLPQYYIVREGDTLRNISYQIYGNYDHVDEICRWNNIEDPNNILYGQKLLLP